MKKRRVQFALGVLMCVGGCMAVFGVLSPRDMGREIAEGVFYELKLPYDADTAFKLADLYADVSWRQHMAVAGVGLLIVVTSCIGLSGTHGE